MSRLNHLVFTLIASVFLVGCTKSDSYSTSNSEEVEVIHGYTLPPKPDPAINNATLFGIDSNNNGIRDDVEIWILKKYKDKHPIYTEIAMQEARADKLILEHPDKALEIHEEVDKPIYCQAYYEFDAQFFNDPILVTDNITNEYFRSKIYFNTKKRMAAYTLYDSLLSGDSYTLPTSKQRKELCDFNTTKFELVP